MIKSWFFNALALPVCSSLTFSERLSAQSSTYCAKIKSYVMVNRVIAGWSLNVQNL